MTKVAFESAPVVQTTKRFHTVCKRVFHAHPAYFPQAEHQGKTIYFCTDACLEAFLADPARFLSAHSRPASRK